MVSELLKAGYRVRALVHREDSRSTRLKAQGAEIAVADLSDVDRVADALRDVQGAYYCPPLDPGDWQEVPRSSQAVLSLLHRVFDSRQR